VDKGVFLPYVTLHSLVQDLLENKTLDLTTPPEWELSQNKFGYYFVGLEVLVMLGYVQRTKSVILPGNKRRRVLIGSADDIKNNYIIYLSTTLGSSIIKENKNKDSRLRKDLKSKEFSSEVFLLLNKSYDSI
jgi:hypothetical protein